MTPNEWFVGLHEALAQDGAELPHREESALLDLARVAAHSSERWTAPVSTYLVGVVLATIPPEERADRIEALVEALEA